MSVVERDGPLPVFREDADWRAVQAELAARGFADGLPIVPPTDRLLAAMLAGVALGFVWEWVREHKHRATAATEKRERQRLEQQVKAVVPSEDKGDDVLALLEGGSATR